VALTAELATVVVKGSDAREGGGLGIGEGTKFRHQRDAGVRHSESPNYLKTVPLYPAAVAWEKLSPTKAL
jgi:hypothetical protein